ncbi:MAG: penicillin-binding transpeptidase domain-containing protein [Porticoccaceae bacterium]|nr:penicillin-binding transpeptidase domain-containing protein [Porticoccaceae bacterium]
MEKNADKQRPKNREKRGRVSARRGSGARVRSIASWRYWTMVVVLFSLGALALSHVAGLQVLPDVHQGFEFLQSQGNNRILRTVEIPAYRGIITDRRGEPLAISTPVVSICANPQLLELDGDKLAMLARRLKLRVGDLKQRIERYRNKEFMYLARQLTPPQAQAVLDLDITGIFKREEYKRYYPAGEVAAQLVGFTGIDDRGQEGMELAFDDWLYGATGSKRVLKDRKGRVIKELQLIESEKPGSNLALSIDLRLQYIAYRELKAAMKQFRAKSGSVVVLDVETGEVLAMVNQPSFNPNDRSRLKAGSTRNRALTDLLEPGSIMKPLTMVAALESGQFDATTMIDTSPGYLRIGRKTFLDHRNYGKLDMGGILAKSSQVGTTKIAMKLDPAHIRGVFDRVGLGHSPGTGFPGESAGLLPSKRRWRDVETATLAFGYGMAATPLQLANAYAVLANNGIKKQVSLLKISAAEGVHPGPEQQVIDKNIVISVRQMMKAVIEKEGTGTRAAINTYDVAGKTGTSHKVGAGGYQKDRYVGLFAGIAPAEKPRLVTVVVIDDPRGEDYYGGLVAAPVFSKVTAEALRLMNVQPLKVPEPKLVKDAGLKRGGDS